MKNIAKGIERELFWPTEEDVKAACPQLTREELERNDKRLSASLDRIKDFIEEIDKSRYITWNDMNKTYYSRN